MHVETIVGPASVAGRDPQDDLGRPPAGVVMPARVTVTGPCDAARPTILRLMRLRAWSRRRLEVAFCLRAAAALAGALAAFGLP